MKESLLLPILRSQTQGDLLALLFLNPDRQYTISDAARTIGVSVPGLHHEAVRLIAAGIISERREGRNRLIRAEMQSQLASAMTELLLLTYGPIPVVERALKGLAGIDAAYIFGSWAARYKGKSGPIPNDVDVLIVGSISLDLLDEISERVGARLHRDVNFKKLATKEWKEKTQPFTKTISRNPHVALKI